MGRRKRLRRHETCSEFGNRWLEIAAMEGVGDELLVDFLPQMVQVDRLFHVHSRAHML